jgi:catechol 2,3-dioxygenase-like lactoylglutathione lyase family enzyme
MTNAAGASDNRFHLTGIEGVKFAVADLEQAVRFATDWGLTRTGTTDPSVYLFRTQDGSEVEIVQADDAIASRRPVGAKSGICEITWGVSDPSALSALEAELRRDRRIERGPDSVVRSVDDLGIGTAFRLAQRRAVPSEPTRYNSPQRQDRLNRRAVRYASAAPHEISHIAIAVDDAEAASRFYRERLGFLVSDRYANRGVFLRCAPAGNHHHLFLMNGRVPGTAFNHLAFKVRDVHEVIGGGQSLEGKGWKTFAGPGRHLVSSACFWYFQSPFGGAWEYAADEDVVDASWESSDFAAQAHIFSEWTFGLEKSDGRLRGPISQSRES